MNFWVYHGCRDKTHTKGLSLMSFSDARSHQAYVTAEVYSILGIANLRSESFRRTMVMPG
jgi:hypothetical protein